MRDSTCILFAILLLNARTTQQQEYSLPYHADSSGECKNPTREYLSDGVPNLCCSKCPPGKKRIEECSDTNDTECQQCGSDQFMEDFNYARNCRRCPECKTKKGLTYAQNCTSTTSSKCVCRTGFFCLMDFEDPYCAECRPYTSCKVGYGVYKEGRKDSNVKCQKCPDGTFSNKISDTERCRPHTDCQGRAVVKHGNATSDTECEPAVAAYTTLNPRMQTEPHGSSVHQTINLQTTPSSLPPGPVSTNDVVVNSEEPTKPQISEPGAQLGTLIGQGLLFIAVIAGVTGLLMVLIIVLVLLIRRKTTRINGEEAQIAPPKIDANGNCERENDVNPCHSKNVELVSFSNISPEQQCLLSTVEPHNKSDISDGFTRIEGCSSQEDPSIGSFESTLPLQSPQSLLSEPMPLLTNTGSISFQPTVLPQPTSQGISPPANVNVNITFHIGNGTCGVAAPIIPAEDAAQAGDDLPLGEEEERLTIPQQVEVQS